MNRFEVSGGDTEAVQCILVPPCRRRGDWYERVTTDIVAG